MERKEIVLYLEGDWVTFNEDLLKEMPSGILKLYMKDSNQQKKQQNRKNRCLIRGARNRAKRCTENCSNCPHVKGYTYDPSKPRPGNRTGGVLSLDSFEDIGKPIPVPVSFEDSIEYAELIERLHAAIDTLGDLDRRIINLFLSGQTEREIAAAIQRGQPFVHYHIHQIIIPALREELKDFF